MVVLQKEKNTREEETLHFVYIQHMIEEPISALVKYLNDVLKIFS